MNRHVCAGAISQPNHWARLQVYLYYLYIFPVNICLDHTLMFNEKKIYIYIYILILYLKKYIYKKLKKLFKKLVIFSFLHKFFFSKKQFTNLRSVWMEEWKSGRIENCGRMENIQFSLLCVWLERWKSGRVENSFVWLERKMEWWKM